MDDDVEEEDVADHSGDDRECDGVQNLIPPPLRFVECADSFLSSEIKEECGREREEPGDAEVPLVLAVERVREGRRKCDAAHSEEDENNRRETAERSDEYGDRTYL